MPGQTEIGDLRRALGREQDVAQLQLAMYDPRLVRHLYGLGQQNHERGHLLRRLQRARERLHQAAPFQQLHREKGAAIILHS